MSARRTSLVLARATVALGLVVAAAPAGAQDPVARARSVLRGSRYTFCHDAARRLRAGERAYCGAVGPASACPEFARACAAPRPAAPRAGGLARLLAALGPAAQYLVLALVAVATAVLAALLARAVARARRTERLVDADARPAPADAPALLPDATAGEILARALDAHRAGDLRGALYGYYAALVRRLDERGVVHVDAAHTMGDYVRQCAPPELKAPLRDATREVERVRFGGVAPSAEACDRLRARVEPLVRALAALVVAVGLGGAVGACGDGAVPGEGAGRPSDTGPAGHRAVREFLAAEGVAARVLREPLEDLRETDRVLVVDPQTVDPSPEQWGALLAWVDRGGALVLAGTARAWPAALRVAPGPPQREAFDAAFTPSFGGEALRVRAGAQLLVDGAGRPVARGPGEFPYAVWLARGEGRVLALGSNELVTNGGLAVGRNAAVTLGAFRAFGAGRAAYFVEHTDPAPDNPLRGLERAGMLPLTLQALLVVALFYLMVGRHFATPRDRGGDARRAFADHVRAVGAMYARARRSDAVRRAYATLVLERARARLPGDARSLPDALAARLGTTRADVERTLAEALEPPAAGRAGAREASDLAQVKRLGDWLRRLG